MSKTDKHHSIVFAMISATRMHHKLFDEALLGAGINSSQHRTLQIIEQAAAPPSQKEIAEKTEISTASVAVTLKKLEKSGYLTREASSPDSRRNEINITDKGRSVLKNTCIAMAQADENMFSGFTDSELEEFKGYLDRINYNLRHRKDMTK